MVTEGRSNEPKQWLRAFLSSLLFAQRMTKKLATLARATNFE